MSRGPTRPALAPNSTAQRSSSSGAAIAAYKPSSFSVRSGLQFALRRPFLLTMAASIRAQQPRPAHDQQRRHSSRCCGRRREGQARISCLSTIKAIPSRPQFSSSICRQQPSSYRQQDGASGKENTAADYKRWALHTVCAVLPHAPMTNRSSISRTSLIISFIPLQSSPYSLVKLDTQGTTTPHSVPP